MKHLINFPIQIILPEYSVSLVNKATDKRNRFILKQMQSDFPYLIFNRKMIWKGQGVPWVKRWFSKGYSFKNVKSKGHVVAVSWREHTVFSLPLLLALRRNGLLTEEVLSETSSNTKGKQDLVLLSFGKYTHQDNLPEIVNEDYPWRLFLTTQRF